MCGSIGCRRSRRWPEDGGPFITLPLVYTTHPDRPGPQPRHVPDAGARRDARPACTGRSARAAAITTRLPRRAESAAGHGVSRRAAGADPVGHRAAAGERARADAGVADCRRAAAAGCTVTATHPLVATRGVRADGRGAAGRRGDPEGPFGDHYGYYSLQHDYPVFDVTRMAHRADAIYPATVVGKPRQEDFFIGDLLQELLSPLFPLVMPAVEQLWSYGETGYHSLGAAVVKQRYKREAMASAFRILGEGQLSLTKFLLRDRSARRSARISARRSSTCSRGRTPKPISTCSRTCRWTRSITPGRRSTRVQRRLARAGRSGARAAATVLAGTPPAGRDRRACVSAAAVWWLAGRPIRARRDAAARIAGHGRFRDWPLVVLTDEPARAARSDMNFLWTTFTRFEPAADIHAADAGSSGTISRMRVRWSSMPG